MKKLFNEQKIIYLHEFRHSHLKSSLRKKARSPNRVVNVAPKKADTHGPASKSENRRNISRARHRIRAGRK